MEKRLINIEELAGYLGIKPQTIRNQLSGGIFPIKPVRIGRVLRWDIRKVDRYIDNLTR